MRYLSNEKFSFQSDAVAKDTFGVVRFTGTEGLSQLYRFDITLVSDDPDLDLDKILRNRALFTILRPDGSDVKFNGIIAQCNIAGQAGEFFLYQVVLVPVLWLLTLSHHNQIFLNQNSKQIITAVLKDGGLTSLNFDFRLESSYVTWEYCCQYEESNYDFICRWMERNGIYYFFEQGKNREKIIFTDNVVAHVPSKDGADLTYAPVSGLEAMHLEEAVQSCVCEKQNIPQNVQLKDYNYRKPSLAISGHSQVSENGVGTMYYYGDHFRTSKEGDKIAKIRAQEILCKAEQYHCESTVPYITSGYQFQLNNHFRAVMNRGYLTTHVQHTGNQVSYLVAGLRELLTTGEEESLYYNSCTAIPDDVQFRTPRTTERPRLHGTISARIDGAETGKYAEIDDHGRYKVILPFDLSGRKKGKASAWIRMMQPYAGDGHGMHFPLHKGTEVLLTFIDGNPDRPIIAGAVPNTETASVVDSGNLTRGGFKSAGGSSFHTEDSESHERLVMKAGDGKSTLTLGAGSESTFGVKSKAIHLAGEGAGAVFGMLSHHQFSILSNLHVTGIVSIPILAVIAEFILEKGTDIAELSDDKKTEEITEVALGAATVLFDLALMKWILKVEKSALKNMAGNITPGHPAFAVLSMGKSTFVMDNAKGDDIYFGTNKGEIINYSKKLNYTLSETEVITIAKDNIKLICEKGKIVQRANKFLFYYNDPNIPMPSIRITVDKNITMEEADIITIRPKIMCKIGVPLANGQMETFIVTQKDLINIEAEDRIYIRDSDDKNYFKLEKGEGVTFEVEQFRVEVGKAGQKNKVVCDKKSARLSGKSVALIGTNVKIKGSATVKITGGNNIQIG